MEEFIVCCFVFLQIFNMSSYQNLADIASSRGDGVDDPNLSSGKIFTCILFIYDLFAAICPSLL